MATYTESFTETIPAIAYTLEEKYTNQFPFIFSPRADAKEVAFYSRADNKPVIFHKREIFDNVFEISAITYTPSAANWTGGDDPQTIPAITYTPSAAIE